MQIFVFAATMFVSACLLFVVQPMIGKMVLPDLGGSAAVWTTCMLFFQTVLLLGYLYAHAITKRFSTRTVGIIHSVLALAALPLSIMSISWVGDMITNPISSLLVTLTLSIGLPFFVISASAPLLQFLFSTTDAPSADDPYQLYAASNLGSLGALVSYPFLIEPMIGLTDQTLVWAGGYVLYIVGLFVCFMFAKSSKKEEVKASSPLTTARRLKWLLWAFIPSSLMLGVTQFVSTDVAPIPLLWLVPLSLYLLTFIIAFSNKFPKWPTLWVNIFLVTLLVPTFKLGMSIGWEIAINYVVFFVIALHFHRCLAEDRPPVDRLTEFFVLLSVGGALGGLFNGVAAPFLFVERIEYAIVLIVAIMSFVPVYALSQESEYRTFVTASISAVIIGSLIAFLAGFERWTLYGIIPMPFVLYGILQVRHPKSWKINLGVALGIVIAVAVLAGVDSKEVGRSFYSTYRVAEGEHKGRKTVELFSGKTLHGIELLDAPNTPYSYFAKQSCFGEIMSRNYKDVGVVGLGAGVTAAYAVEGVKFDFFEIDEMVVTLARKHFSYLDTCGERCNVEVGDGRRLLAEKSDASYDIVFLDAYNSDAVPTHLLTTEAIAMYRSKLKPNGIMVFHVSNRYLMLEHVVSSSVKKLGLASVEKGCETNDELMKIGPIFPSSFVVVGAKEDLGYLINRGWKPMEYEGKEWTDDFTNVSSVLRWH